MTIDPGIAGIEFVSDDKAGKPSLILRDAQHEYRFVAKRWRASAGALRERAPA